MDDKFRRLLFRPQYRENDEKKRSVPRSSRSYLFGSHKQSQKIILLTQT